MATRRLVNFDDVVEDVLCDLDDLNLVNSEEKQLDEDFIYVNRRIIAFEPDFEEAKTFQVPRVTTTTPTTNSRIARRELAMLKT